MKVVAIVVTLCLLARVCFVYANQHAPVRHARWKMRAKLAELIYRNKLRPVKGVKNGKLVR